MDTGPMVVHCSAGVGRTGTFVIIDSMVQRILNGGVDIDIYAHLCLLRNQRNHMVQTEDQYFFIHEAINEAIACGVTDVTPEVFPTYLDRLELIQEDGESSLLELEFKKLATDRTEPHLFASATRNVNKGKNRFVNIMPYEYNRVKLSFLRATEGSDYINASYIDSYRQQHAFIATQGPLKHTSSDFWRMIWEKKSPIIVMLTRLEERQQECSAYYWSDTEVKHGDITVKMSTRRAIGDYCIYRDFTLTDNQSNRTHLVRHYQYLGWPERGVPTSALPLLQIIQEVQEIYATLRTTDPITVMCSSGVGRTGVFITLHIILERYEVEGYIDLFQTVKMLRIQRSAMVQTHEQYHFCYEAVLDYLLNTGQLPHIRSLSITRRSSHINLTNPSSPTLHSPVEIMSSPVGSQHALNGTTNEMTSVV
jgi:protein tyrosine phosphatase